MRSMKILTARPHRLLEACVGRLGEATERGESCMFLVPAQYTLQAEIEIMERLRVNGSFLIDVLSPKRLQSRVFELAGMPKQTIFDERGKCMVLSAIIEEQKDELVVYRGAAQNGTPGFTARVSNMIASLKRSGLSAADVAESAEKMEENQPAKAKLRDIARLYAAYEQKMAGELADAEDVSREMCARFAASGVFKGQNVFVYGFDVITPTFAEELLSIAPLCKSLTLAIETDENAAPDGRLFAPVNYSLERLEKLAKERKIVVEREKLETELDAPTDIRLLEKRLYAIGGAPCMEKPTAIELLAASGKRQEVHLAAARMRRLAAAGEDIAQMAVVYPKQSGYGALLQNILPMYGLSAYVAEKRQAGAHPLSRFLLSALAALSGGWRLSDILECAQSGFLGLSQDELDRFCAYCEGTDIRGEAMRKPFRYPKGATEEELAVLEESRKRIVTPLLALQDALQTAKTADDTIHAVLALLENVHAYETLEDMRDELNESGLTAEAQDCAQVWNAMMTTLDQLHTLLGGQAVPAKIMMGLLQNGLSALELAALPPADGAVICGEIGNVRTAQVQTLFAIGMNDMPAGNDNGLLTVNEQLAAQEISGAYLGMTPQESAALGQLDELKALSGARAKMIVSYAVADETGRALREGDAVQALRRLFPNMPVYGGLAQEERETMLCAETPALEALAVEISEAADGRHELSGEYAATAAAIALNAEGEERLLSVTRGLGDPPEKRMTGVLARTLYGRPVSSVSRLETFAQCPYKHFVRYGLVPKQEQRPGVDAAELGTLYHEAAERFTDAVTALPEFPEVSQEVCDRLMDEAVSPLIDAWRESPMGESKRGEAVAKRIRRTAKRTARNIISQYADSSFRPMQMEFVFGQNGISPIVLELADGSFAYLQGRIDRVDVMTGGGLRVIDYKSGSRKFDPTLVYWGLQLQLLLYLAAALARVPGSHAAGFFYCRIADPTIKTESRIREEVEKQIAKKLALNGISLSDVAILRAQGGQQAAMVTKEGKPNGRFAASMVDEAGMEKLLSFAQHKAASLAGEIYGGEIDDSPVERNAFNACQNCEYSAICVFDPMRKPRRRMTTKKLEDLM